MKRILVVDDDDLVRGYLRRLLAAEGYEVIEASNGQEAVRRCGEGPLDLIVTDLYMPGMSGLDALLELDSRSSSVPVIAVSGGGSGATGDALALARNLGAARVFQKPFDTVAFVAAVRSLAGPP